MRIGRSWMRSPGPTLLALGLLLSGCATTAPGSGEAPLVERVEDLRATVRELERRNTVNEVELQRLRIKVAELELAARRAQSAPSERPPAVAAPSVAQRGPEDPIDVAPPLRIETRELEPELVARPTPSIADDPVAAPQPDPASESLPETAVASPRAALDADAQALYDRGYTEYNRRQFVSAEATFQRFLQRYPDTSLADNAQYWIGEARAGRGDQRGALAAFRETVNRYPDGNKAADALLRSGKLYEELGDEEAALQSYREVLRRFPDSAEALLAGDHIRRLDG